MRLTPSSFFTSIVDYTFTFKQPAGTSRGIYTSRKGWYIIIISKEDPNHWGIGECAPLPGLSIDDDKTYLFHLAKALKQLREEGYVDRQKLRFFPSILFGIETALRQYEQNSFVLWDTPFTRGEKGIPINGLIWMGDQMDMLQQIETKIKAGYRCIKLKIGAIDFDEELSLLRHIRRNYSEKDIELRVDANGAFSPDDALEKLHRLADYQIHSIEQPIRAGQWEKMRVLTQESPIPIVLDEELIGGFSQTDKQTLLETIHPQFIILKPSLHGGISGCNEWIEEATKRGIQWWATSALESNIGLNAIAQWCATWSNPLPQGLGTGQLFTENIPLPLSIRKDCLWFNPLSTHLESTLFSFFEKNKKESRKKLIDILPEWFNTSPYMEVKTSGSTGEPQTLKVYKEQMIQSARNTCHFLQLKRGEKALLCMPTDYIAGKMMVVRSIVAKLDLIAVKPSGHPLKEVNEPIDFAAMTPTQVYNSLQEPNETEKLRQIKTLLIGGSFVDKEMESMLSSFPNRIYATYGMTETLSHIALRRLNGEDASLFYTPFPSVKVWLSEEGTLVIDAPLVSDTILYTHDLAQINEDGSFLILGRKDNVINSGGVKIQIEELEKWLYPTIRSSFAITSIPDKQYGEAIVLLIEGTEKEETIKAAQLPKYYYPKYTLNVVSIPHTQNGKIDRIACKKLALSLIK